jgi:hypothetical protein
MLTGGENACAKSIVSSWQSERSTTSSCLLLCECRSVKSSTGSNPFGSEAFFAADNVLSFLRAASALARGVASP